MPADAQKVHWREILSLPTPDGVQISLDTQEEKPAPPASAGQPKKSN